MFDFETINNNQMNAISLALALLNICVIVSAASEGEADVAEIKGED